MAAKKETETKASAGPPENKASPDPVAAAAEKDIHHGNQHREAAEASEFHQATAEAREAAAKAEKAAQARSGADYGESSRKAHEMSGYRLTDAHYAVPKAIERQKDVGKERGMKQNPRDKADD